MRTVLIPATEILQLIRERIANKPEAGDLLARIDGVEDPVKSFELIRDICLADKKNIPLFGRPLLRSIVECLQRAHPCPAFDKGTIEDGDNVESEDFEPGQGGRLIPMRYVQKPLPPVPDHRTEQEKEADRDFIKRKYMSTEEKIAEQDAYLKQYGL